MEHAATGLMRTLLFDMHLWLPLAAFAGWLLLRGRRGIPWAAVLMLGAGALVVFANLRDDKVYCPGRGYLDAAGMVRLWRAAVVQHLTGRPQPPWCEDAADCRWLKEWRGPAAPEAQVALVLEALRLVEECARERGDFHRCRQLLRKDSREACGVTDCAPYRYTPRPWLFEGSPIRAIVFARDPEGMTVDFRIYVGDAEAAPFPRPVAPGYARAFAARLHLYHDSLTGNHCPDAQITVGRP